MTLLRRSALLGLGLLVLTSFFALGQGHGPFEHPGGPGGPDGPGGHGPGGPPDPVMGLAGRILHNLDLSETQKSRIHALVRTHVDSDLKPLIQDFGEARHELENRVWSPAATEKDIAEA